MRDYHLLVGGSTGTVLAAVQKLASEFTPGDTIVAISADLGDKLNSIQPGLGTEYHRTSSQGARREMRWQPLRSSTLFPARQLRVQSTATGREFEAVEAAYRLHAAGKSVNPNSSFLRYPNNPTARIIALPAHLGGKVKKSGIKWISSFPANRAGNLARASAVQILNDATTGYPLACIEASLISATRTAASAVLAAQAVCSLRLLKAR